MLYVIIRTSLPGFSARSLDMSDVTLALGSWAIAVPLVRHSMTNAKSLVVKLAGVPEDVVAVSTNPDIRCLAGLLSELRFRTPTTPRASMALR
jgi:hypothetical protein